jgi:CysZ protein
MLRLLSGFGLITGATYPLRAIALLLRKPSLWQYLIIPIFVNLVLGILLYGSSLYWGWQGVEALTTQLSQSLDQLIAELPNWLSFLEYILLFLSWLLRTLLTILLFVLIGFVLLQFGSVIGSPWYGKLSEQVEKQRLGSVTIIDVGIFKDIARALLFELKKLLLALTVGMILFLVGFIPGFGGILTTIGGVTLTATLVCLDCFDSTLERRRLLFWEKLKTVYRNLPASGSFSLLCLVLISVPLLNLITIPLCIMAGTLFLCDRVFAQSH